MTDLSAFGWRRSSWCAGSNCVEVARAGGQVALRDSKTVDGAVLIYTPDEWGAFVKGVKSGEFDFVVET